MSKLQDFLNENDVLNLTKEVEIGERFIDESGEKMLFKIKALSFSQIEELKSQAKQGESGAFYKKVCIKGCLDPVFNDAKSIEAVRAYSPENYIEKVMLPGEIEMLAGCILSLSGYLTKFSTVVKEAKN